MEIEREVRHRQTSIRATARTELIATPGETESRKREGKLLRNREPAATGVFWGRSLRRNPETQLGIVRQLSPGRCRENSLTVVEIFSSSLGRARRSRKNPRGNLGETISLRRRAEQGVNIMGDSICTRSLRLIVVEVPSDLL